MTAVAALVLGIGVAAALAFTAFRKNMMYFYTPTDLVAQAVPAGAKIRLGGLVVAGTLQRGEGLDVRFTVADCEQSVPVRYSGILPDLFREGQGIVATGRVGPDGVFMADEVLAKHDENYMPPELAEKLVAADGRHSCAEFSRPVMGRRPAIADRPSQS
nr:cytochrome c maturation protein CcmE [Fontimonas thermophila]